MMASVNSVSHEEAWLSLPWLANGRLSQAERDQLEPHVQTCTACREELALQRRFCNALTEPERVIYAPGPSFRKLMERIDGVRTEGSAPVAAKPADRTNITPLTRQSENRVPLWRPPGLAWAAGFVLAIGLTGALTSMYESSQAKYRTYTDGGRSTPDVLHIAFDRAVTVGEAEEALRSTGARIVEGPDSRGMFGIAPSEVATGDAVPGHVSQAMHLLSTRLRADPRVRWVEPIPGENPTTPLSRGP
jgi:Putative zinc-finger